VSEASGPNNASTGSGACTVTSTTATPPTGGALGGDVRGIRLVEGSTDEVFGPGDPVGEFGVDTRTDAGPLRGADDEGVAHVQDEAELEDEKKDQEEQRQDEADIDDRRTTLVASGAARGHGTRVQLKPKLAKVSSKSVCSRSLASPADQERQSSGHQGDEHPAGHVSAFVPAGGAGPGGGDRVEQTLSGGDEVSHG
jgi:hypothetical protein